LFLSYLSLSIAFSDQNCQFLPAVIPLNKFFFNFCKGITLCPLQPTTSFPTSGAPPPTVITTTTMFTLEYPNAQHYSSVVARENSQTTGLAELGYAKTVVTEE
jgi:hypothetical protein